MTTVDGILDYESVNSTCANWNTYSSADDLIQVDSGI